MMGDNTTQIDQDNISKSSPFLEEIKEFWFYFSENKGAVAGLFFILIIVIVALFAPLLAPYGPNIQYPNLLKSPPIWMKGGVSGHIFGTDDVGRDILSRIMYGARYSLMIGVIVVIFAVGTGTLIGLVVGYVRGTLEVVTMRLMDIILSIPSLLLALVLVAVLEPNLAGTFMADILDKLGLDTRLTSAMIAIALTQVPHYVRLTRASVIMEKNRDYVTASRVMGAGPWRLMFSTILPNCLGPIIVQGSLSFSTAILDAAALGFLGMGAKPPTPEWGTMLATAREFLTSGQWWIATFPGLAILFTVLAINLMGDGLRDALDPKMKRS